jgi:hypothetical protein
MTAAKVRQIVEREIGGDWSRTNAHGCDFKRCLVEPHLAEFEDCGHPGASEMLKLWVVLEEDPDTCRGYQIVFEEDSGKFGLACPGLNGPVYLGPYAGGFLGTFDAM